MVMVDILHAFAFIGFMAGAAVAGWNENYWMLLVLVVGAILLFW